MAIDFTRYQTPGVYTESVPGPQLAVRSSVPTAVATFGRAVGYRTYRESLIIDPDTGAITTVQTITVVGTPTSGVFTPSFDGEAVDTAIPIDAAASTVKTSLETIAALSGNITVTGGTGGPWTVTFIDELGGTSQPEIAIDSTVLVPSTGTSVEVVKEDQGTPAINRTLAQKGIKIDPVPVLDPKTGDPVLKPNGEPVTEDAIKVVDPNTGTPYHEGTDYVIVRTSVGDDLATKTRDDTYTISRVIDGGAIQPGQTVQLAYNYTDPDYFKVYALYDFDDVRDIYGEPFDKDGNIQSEVTLAAQFAFTNGASTVLTCAIDSPNPNSVGSDEYKAALDKFRDEEQIAIIVPGTGAQWIQGMVQQHVVAQSNNKYERRAILGMDGSKTPILSGQRITNAQQLTEQRIALISPASFDYYSTEMNQFVPLGGQYMAAAVAGLAASQIAAEPLTHKRVLGFSGPTESQREGEKNLESSNGLMVIERTRRQIVQVRHGVTTNPTDLLTREWNIIGQQDVMVYRIRDYLDADGLIGQAIYDTTLIQVKASAESALDSLTRDRIIVGYQNLKVRQIGTMPDVVEVRFEWRPAYPLNYIVVRYSVAVMSGDVTITETTL